MTPEEIEKTLSSILAIQKELQETHIKQGQNIDRVTAEMMIKERLANLAQRVEPLENRIQSS